MLRDELFPSDEFDRFVAEGYITERFHDEHPLAIANYTPLTQYSRNWNEITRVCRGLIYNRETLEIVSRPFPKFMNWDETREPIPTGPALRMEKLDGSLGILYTIRGTVRAIATRGSFHSEQATWATEHYRSTVNAQWFGENRIPEMEDRFDPRADKTYLFEIIYKENRIVIDYGDYEGLILIDVIDNETGRSDLQEYDDCKWPDKGKRQHIPSFDSGQVVDVPPGDEGFVYLWPEKNHRVKLKTPDYVALHRLVSNLNPKTIWEHLVKGGTKEELKRDLPEEFWGFIDETVDEIQGNAHALFAKSVQVCCDIRDRLSVKHPEGYTRKQYAMEAVKHPEVKGFLFMLEDRKSIWVDCLKAVKPSASSDKD